jgi:hypothetical protein
VGFALCMMSGTVQPRGARPLASKRARMLRRSRNLSAPPDLSLVRCDGLKPYVRLLLDAPTSRRAGAAAAQASGRGSQPLLAGARPQPSPSLATAFGFVSPYWSAQGQSLACSLSTRCRGNQPLLAGARPRPAPASQTAGGGCQPLLWQARSRSPSRRCPPVGRGEHRTRARVRVVSPSCRRVAALSHSPSVTLAPGSG